MLGAFGCLALSALLLANDEKPREQTTQRPEESAAVLTKIASGAERAIPEDLLHKAYCIAIVPNETRLSDGWPQVRKMLPLLPFDEERWLVRPRLPFDSKASASRPT